MKIDKITSTSDLIEFLLDQYEQTRAPAFLAAANSLYLYEANCNLPTFSLDQQNKWINVKDKLPIIHKDVLVYHGKFIGELMNIYTYMGDNEWIDESGYLCSTDGEGITHWQPLPELPKED